MGTTWLVVLAAILCISATTSGTEYVGCLFSEELCRQDTEWCFDDGAFGRCINNNDATTPEDLYRYGLDAEQLSVLEAELDRLLETGYRWSHRHTQCVLQALLYAFQSGRDFENVLCEHLKDKDLETVLRSGNEELDPRNMAYIKYTPSIVDPQTDFADELYVPPKQDEEEEVLDEVPYVVRRSLPDQLHFSPLYNTPDHFRSGLEMRDMSSAGGSRFVDRAPEADDEANDVHDSRAFNRGVYHPAGRPSLDHPYAALRNTLSLLQDNNDGGGGEEERGPGEATQDLDPEQVGHYIKSVLRPTYFLFRKPTSVSEPQSDQEDNEEEAEGGLVELGGGGLVEVGGGYTEGGAVYQPEDEEELLLPELLDRLGFKRRERVDVKKPGPPYVPQLQEGETSEKKANADKAKNNTSGGQKETVADTPHVGNSGTQRRHSKSSSWSEKLRAEKKLAKEVEVDVTTPEYDVVDTDYAYIQFKESIRSWKEGEHIVNTVAKLLHVPQAAFSHARVDRNEVTFKVVQPNPWALNASEVARRVENLKEDVRQEIGVMITSTGIGDKTKLPSVLKLDGRSDHEVVVVGVVVVGVLAAVALSAGVLYLTRKHGHKLRTVAKGECEPMSKLYQDLCRARMSAKTPTQQESSSSVPAHRVTTSLSKESDKESPSSRSSTSSWSDEPALTNMDVTTGQMVLSYMEEHLKNKERLDSEWAALCAYEADPSATTIAQRPENLQKNRYPHALPYDHARVVLNELSNITGSDYINASTITDHDPRNPAYIVTQGPLPHTAPDLWQMVWEQGCVAMVMLTRLGEPDSPLCHHYWPPEGSELYHVYEVHLVSEHIWCDDYLVRSFYLKNLKTGETRTVTQFHFMSWPEGGVPSSTKPLLEFRRKVNKSFRGRSCPIVLHCSDGVGRSGAYVLLDMVLNRIAKGAKEIDVAATLEHIRDQRAGALTTKPQFQFVLQAVADEVHAILKILPPPTTSASQ